MLRSSAKFEGQNIFIPRHGPQERDIQHAVMSRAVRAHNARAVHTEHHMQAGDGHVVNQLVIRALQERGVYRNDRQQPLRRHAGRHRRCMLLRNADVEKASRKPEREWSQTSTRRHCRRDRADASVLFRKGAKLLSEKSGKIHFPGRFEAAGQRVKAGNAVIFFRLLLARRVAAPLLRHYMQQHGFFHFFAPVRAARTRFSDRVRPPDRDR